MENKNILIVSVVVFLIMLNISMGCVTMGKNTIKEVLATPTPEPTEIITPAPTKEITPFPTITESAEDQLYRSGGRYVGKNFSILRYDVVGNKDLHVETKVYDIESMRFYHWWSKSWGQWFIQYAGKGWQYIFVFVRLEMVGNDQSWDPSMWGFDSGNFWIEYQDVKGETHQVYEDPDHAKCLVIQEYADGITGMRKNLNDDTFISDYGVKGMRASNGTFTCVNQSFLRMGSSNAWDGYIIYKIPDYIKIKDIKVHLIAGSFGNPYWVLNSTETA